MIIFADISFALAKWRTNISSVGIFGIFGNDKVDYKVNLHELVLGKMTSNSQECFHNFLK